MKPSSRTALFSLELTGSGSAATWFDLYNGQYLADYELEYKFAEAAPVPEPSTLMLLGTGAIGLLRWRARRGWPSDR